MWIPKKEMYALGWIVIITGLVIAVSLVNRSHRVDLAKKDITIAELKTKANKKSDIELLSELSSNYKKQADIDIEKIKELQKEYEYDLLSYICYKKQIERLVDWEDLDKKFCTIKTNLELFRTKK